MAFFIGVLFGIGVALAVRALYLACLPLPGVEKPGRITATQKGKQWEQTRNFLYYDGTEMPSVKLSEEEYHEQ